MARKVGDLFEELGIDKEFAKECRKHRVKDTKDLIGKDPEFLEDFITDPAQLEIVLNWLEDNRGKNLDDVDHDAAGDRRRGGGSSGRPASATRSRRRDSVSSATSDRPLRHDAANLGRRSRPRDRVATRDRSRSSGSRPRRLEKAPIALGRIEPEPVHSNECCAADRDHEGEDELSFLIGVMEDGARIPNRVFQAPPSEDTVAAERAAEDTADAAEMSGRSYESDHEYDDSFETPREAPQKEKRRGQAVVDELEERLNEHAEEADSEAEMSIILDKASDFNQVELSASEREEIARREIERQQRLIHQEAVERTERERAEKKEAEAASRLEKEIETLQKITAEIDVEVPSEFEKYELALQARWKKRNENAKRQAVLLSDCWRLVERHMEFDGDGDSDGAGGVQFSDGTVSEEAWRDAMRVLRQVPHGDEAGHEELEIFEDFEKNGDKLGFPNDDEEIRKVLDDLQKQEARRVELLETQRERHIETHEELARSHRLWAQINNEVGVFFDEDDASVKWPAANDDAVAVWEKEIRKLTRDEFYDPAERKECVADGGKPTLLSISVTEATIDGEQASKLLKAHRPIITAEIEDYALTSEPAIVESDSLLWNHSFKFDLLQVADLSSILRLKVMESPRLGKPQKVLAESEVSVHAFLDGMPHEENVEMLANNAHVGDVQLFICAA